MKYLLSLPERLFRALAAGVGGLLYEATEVLLPTWLRRSHLYQSTIARLLRIMIELVGGRMLLDVVAYADRLDVGMSGDPAVERAEEIDTGIGIVFPAILPVENEAQECRSMAGVAAGGLPHRFHLGEEVIDGVVRLVALILESDLVAHGMVAEDDLQRRFLTVDPPRTIEHFRIAQKAVPIT